MKTKRTKKWIKVSEPVGKGKNKRPAIKVDAIVVEGYDGLFANPMVYRDDETGEWSINSRRWTVTHEASGLRFHIKDERGRYMVFKSKEGAISLIIAVGHLCDWTLSADELPRNSELKEIVWEVMNQCGAIAETKEKLYKQSPRRKTTRKKAKK